MSVEIFSIEWEHEDELPQDMEDVDYALCYQQSKIVDGFRMFPFVRDWDHKKDCERKVYLGA